MAGHRATLQERAAELRRVVALEEVGVGVAGEELGVRPLPGVFDPVVERAARYVFGRAVNRLLRWE